MSSVRDQIEKILRDLRYLKCNFKDFQDSLTMMGISYVVTNYSELSLIVPTEPSFAYAVESQGTQWLPGSFGGTYYGAGLYFWNGTTWVKDNTNVFKQLNDILVALANKSDIGHTHVKTDITDFNEADYATAAQGALADTAIQPGDLAFVAISGDYDDLTNKPVVPVTDHISSFEADGYIYSGYIVDGVDTIKRYKDSVVQFAQGVTDLFTDWTNRLSLTYV